MIDLAAMLKTAREARGETLSEAAWNVGVSHQAYGQWERGAIPSMRYAVALSKTLKIPLKRLCEAAARSELKTRWR